jgi:protein-disulfide isomerase
LDATKRPRTVTALLLGALLPALACGTAEGTSQDDLRAARTKGSANAPVTIYEMSDFQCPYCAQFVRQSLPDIEREYVATGKVKLVFVNFPLPMHPNAEPAAELAMCAARQGRFWQTHDLLFRHQEEWENLREPATYFLALGDSAGADREALVQCLRSGSTRDLVRADAEGSTRSGATGTPSFYIEGGLMRGLVPMPVFRQVLDSIIRMKTNSGR